MRHLMRQPGPISVVIVFSYLLAGCSESSTTERSANLDSASRAYPCQIVTTCGMVTDIVRIVAGEHGHVVGLMGEGVDPHMYKPTRDDVKKLLEADVIFYSGLMLEGRMGDAFAKVGRKGKPVYPITEGIDPDFLLEPPEFEGHTDPHVWMDVSAWMKAVDVVAEALAEYDASHANDYRKNATAYKLELEKLHAYVQKVIGSIPEEQRVLITAHDAFGYFSQAYGIPVASAQGLTTESDPGLEDKNRLIDLIVKKKVNAIFVETSVNSTAIQSVIEGAKSKGANVRIGGKLFSDAMGPAGTYEGTYIGMMDHNATVVARALGGEAPEKGFQGKLDLSSQQD